MRNTRAHERFPFDALGFLEINTDRIPVQTVNLSRNGACLRLTLTLWTAIEDFDQVKGRLNLGGEDFNFTGRICWSASQEEHIHFGLEFVESDRQVMDGVLESMSIMHEDPPSDTFNL